MRVCPQNVTQKHYLDEGGFGVIYAASVKLQVSMLICPLSVLLCPLYGMPYG